MSGVAGADRVKSREDFRQFLSDYQAVISKFPGFISMRPSGSYNSDPTKKDFGDIDLVVHIQSEMDKTALKKELVNFFHKMPETVIVPFTSAKHTGRRSYNSGEIVTVRFHDAKLGYSAQIDNIVALDQKEASFKEQFLNFPAAKQGLILGLVKVATIETDPAILFQKLGITVQDGLAKDQEYEFNLSSVELQLRKVTYEPGTFKQADREILWTSRNFEDLQKLLYQYDLALDFDKLLHQSKQTLKNPRSSNRMQGVFSSMISVKSGEVGTAKGAEKTAALDKVRTTFGEYLECFTLAKQLNEDVSKKVVMAFGRFQPPTIGHELLINTVKNIAAKEGADYVIYVSKTQDHKSNPLSIDQKMHYLKLMFPGTNFVAADANVRTPVEAVKHLNNKYGDIVWVAGSDRATAFQELLNKYNGVEFKYHTAKVVSSGDRDPDSDDAAGMSATKMRTAAIEDNIQSFRQGLPRTFDNAAAEGLMKAVKAGLVKPARKTAVKKDVAPVESGDIGSITAGKPGVGSGSYVSMRAKEFESIEEAGIPKTVVKLKHSLNAMSPDQLLARFEEVSRTSGKSIEELARSMAWRHGYGKNSSHYWDIIQRAEPGGIETDSDDWFGEAMLPKSAFAGADKNPINGKGMARGEPGRSQKAPLTGLLVGGQEDDADAKVDEKQRLDPKCWKGYKKSGTKMKGGTKVNNCVKIGEGFESQISNLIAVLEGKEKFRYQVKCDGYDKGKFVTKNDAIFSGQYMIYYGEEDYKHIEVKDLEDNKVIWKWDGKK